MSIAGVERCPGCRARLMEESVCPRCGCDLTLVRRTEIQAGQLLHRALYAWAKGDRHLAQESAGASLALARGTLGQAVLGCVCGTPTEQK
ncbi:MAG: hypothetical protein ACKVQA_23510 [Burkholderiales bacterium]